MAAPDQPNRAARRAGHDPARKTGDERRYPDPRLHAPAPRQWAHRRH